MTTDTTALQERIRRARSAPAEWARLREGESTREQIERHQHRMDEQTAALIAAEVRAASERAWGEGVAAWRDYESGLDPRLGHPRRDTPLNPYRDTGDSDDHR